MEKHVFDNEEITLHKNKLQSYKMETWSLSKHKYPVILTDNLDGFVPNTGHVDPEYCGQGKALICESVYRQKDKHLISAAPDMFNALISLSEDKDKLPEHKWAQIENALLKAIGSQPDTKE